MSKPITNMSKNIESVSIQTFKSNKLCLKNSIIYYLDILSYCGERKSSKKEIRHAQKLIIMAMGSPSEVRDEIYFQVIKQLHKNPNK